LNPQDDVPQVRPSAVQELASQPEQVPSLHVAVVEFFVQSKQSLPPAPQEVASVLPERQTPFLMHPAQHDPFKQTPVADPAMQPVAFAIGVWVQDA
jgi:hypothetical protein